MRKLAIIVLAAAHVVAHGGVPEARTINVLMIVPRDYGANYFLYVDDLEEKGWNITTAGTSRTLAPCPLFGKPVAGCGEARAEVLLEEVGDISGYDCVALAASTSFVENPFGDLSGNGKLLSILREAGERQKVIWGQCGVVKILGEAGILVGKKVVGNPKFAAEYAAAGAEFLGNDHPPVVDGNIVTTARGQYYHFQNSDAVMTAVERIFPDGDPDGAENNLNMIDEPVDGVEAAAWARAFGGDGSEGARAIAAARDGGLIVAGYTDSWGNGFSDILLLKTDPDGVREWATTFGGTGWEYGYAVCAASDGGYIVAGSTTSWGSGSRDFLVIRTDSAGKAVWSRALGGPGADVAASVCETGNGDILVCGQTDSYGRGEEDVFLARMDGGGKVLWTRTFGHDRFEMGRSVFETDGGDIVVAGATGSPRLSGNNADFYLLRADSSGNLKWEKAYGNSASERPYDAGRHGIRTSDGGCLVVGDSNVRPPHDLYVLKTDSAGGTEWLKNFGGRFYDYACAAVESAAGYLVCGTRIDADSEDRDIYLTEIGPGGAELSTTCFRLNGHDRAGGICLSGDGGCVIAGDTSSGGAGGRNLFIMKIARKGAGS